MKAFRKKLKMTQADLAEAIGISRAAIANIERGKSAPRSKTPKMIAEALRVNESLLYGNAEKLANDADMQIVVEGMRQELSSNTQAATALAQMTGSDTLEELSLKTALGVVLNALGFEIPALQRKTIRRNDKHG